MRLKIQNLNKNKLFFTADTHFSHSNIIKFCDRPFPNAWEMNKELIKLWNENVGPNDVIFHLGDFSLGNNPKKINEILNSLNGQIYLIIGNHEKDVLKKDYTRNRFSGIYDIAEIFVDDDDVLYGKQHIVMCHYPMITWNSSHRNSWQLFGHVHGNLNGNKILKPTQLDVGVDSHNFKPISYNYIKNLYIERKTNCI